MVVRVYLIVVILDLDGAGYSLLTEGNLVSSITALHELWYQAKLKGIDCFAHRSS